MPKKHHKIKISPEFFWQVFKGEKTFQIRKTIAVTELVTKSVFMSSTGTVTPVTHCLPI